MDSNSFVASGVEGTLLVGYQTAAVLGRWRLRDGLLVATVTSKNVFWCERADKVFTLRLKLTDRRAYRWHDVAVEFESPLVAYGFTETDGLTARLDGKPEVIELAPPMAARR